MTTTSFHRRLVTVLPPREVTELLLENIPALLFVKDEELRIVAANDVFLSLYPEELRAGVVGSTTAEDYSPEQREKFFEQDRLALSKGFTEATETIDFPSGERRTLLTRKVGYTSRSNRRYVIGIASDITQLEQWRSEVTWLGEIIESSTTEVYVASLASGRFIQANRGALQNLGYDLETLRSLTPGDITSPASRPTVERAFHAFAAGAVGRAVLEVRHIRADGTEYDATVQVHIADRNGEAVLVGFAQDTTELRSSRDALREKNAELREFAYRTSHDLRAPLVTSDALLERALSSVRAGRTDEAAGILERARSLLNGLEHLTTDISALALQGIRAPSIAPCPPADVVDEAVERVSGLPGFDSIRLERVDGYQGALEADPERLRAVVENLLTNAVKYHDPAKEDRWILIVTRELEGGGFELEVEDNGRGIPPEYREKVFSMFARFHPRISTGSGLGLYLVKQAAEQLGGDVRYADTGDGSLFRFRLPRRVR